MTSSLVGSEMCIRDSSLSEEMDGWQHYAWTHLYATPFCTSTYLPPDTIAVSYTHLTLPTICSV
eukprot:3347370-Prorocentrum_lima.AAC.1